MLSKRMTADGIVVAQATGIKMLKSFHVVGIGATAGDYAVLRTGGSGGAIVAQIVMPSANCSEGITFPEPGIPFGDGIYYDEVVAATGKLFATVVWD